MTYFTIEKTKNKELVMVEVESSLISAVTYDTGRRQLYVKFYDGTIYRYENVQAETHIEMLLADSIGGYFTTHIKKHPDKYPYTKLEVTGESRREKQ